LQGGDAERFENLIAGRDRIDADLDADRPERMENLSRAAANPNNLESIGQSTRTRAPSSPTDAVRSEALRAIERSGLGGAAADRLEAIIRAVPVVAAYVKAVSADAYRTAWRATMLDPERAEPADSKPPGRRYSARPTSCR
jgi:hypothetical protein